MSDHLRLQVTKLTLILDCRKGVILYDTKFGRPKEVLSGTVKSHILSVSSWKRRSRLTVTGYPASALLSANRCKVWWTGSTMDFADRMFLGYFTSTSLRWHRCSHRFTQFYEKAPDTP